MDAYNAKQVARRDDQPVEQLLTEFRRNNVVHVGDVAVGHINAATMGRVSERYILGHQHGNLTLQAIIERAAVSTGAQPPRLAIPASLAYLAALVDEYLLSALTRQDPRATVAGVRLARARQFFNPAKAIEELDLPQTPLSQTFDEAVSWFRTLSS